jgi:hypothetical protein
LRRQGGASPFWEVQQLLINVDISTRRFHLSSTLSIETTCHDNYTP